jgi:hypothetical protein
MKEYIVRGRDEDRRSSTRPIRLERALKIMAPAFWLATTF